MENKGIVQISEMIVMNKEGVGKKFLNINFLLNIKIKIYIYFSEY